MWEKLVNCIKKGGAGYSKRKGCQGVSLADLKNQVPPNQHKQFKIFVKKHEEYKERVRKYPESLPAIDWEYYRKNVRPEFVDWVKKYEAKYDKLHSLYENRHAIVDHKRYFKLVDDETEVVLKEIWEYKDASNIRIKEYTERLELLKALKPYDQMTMEEFCIARPSFAPDFINKPTFWPHTPEEQMPGPSDPAAAAALHEEDHEPPEPPKKPPPSEAQEKSAAVAAPEKPAAAASGETMKNVEAMGSDLAENATKFAKDLLEKATVLFYNLKEKLSVLAKDVQKKAEAAKAARKEAADKKNSGASADSAVQKSLDSYAERDSKPSICNQTIIRSEEEARNPEVKARHADLTIEAEPCQTEEDRIRQKTRDLERRRQKEEQRERDGICQVVPKPCKPKEMEPVCEPQTDPCESMEKEPVCETQPDPCESMKKEPVCEPQPDPCESKKEEAVCEPQPDPCESKKEETVCEPQPDPCKPNKNESCNAEKEDSDSDRSLTESKETEKAYISISECSEEVQKKEQEKKPGDKPKESASLTEKIEGIDQKLIMDQQVAEFKDPKCDENATIGGTAEVGPYTDCNQIAELLAKAKKAKEAKESKEAKVKTMEAALIKEAAKPVIDKPVTIYPRREIKAKPQVPETNKKTSGELAKDVHSMAQGAASLLSEATKILDDLKQKKEVRIDDLEKAYTSAQRQALGALAEASKAVNAANKLAKRSREAAGAVSSQDQEALAMAEKHAVVAKMLANRAVALKDEIARVLKDLKMKG